MKKIFLTLLICGIPFLSLAEEVNSVFDDLVAAMDKKKVFSRKSSENQAAHNKQYSEVWRGVESILESKINDVEIQFKPPENTKKRPFSVFVKFEKDNVIVRHGLAAEKKARGGIRFYPHKQPWDVYIHGANRTGLRVAVPKCSKDVKAVLLCPRDILENQTSSTKAKNYRMDLDYTISDAKYDLDAYVRSGIKSSLEKSLVVGTITVSENLPQPTRSTDFSYARYPELAVRYEPGEPINPGSSNDAFIKAEVLLHNSAGYKYVQSKSDNIRIQTVNLADGQLKPVSQKNVVYRFLGGMCAAVIQWEGETEAFSKEGPPEPPVKNIIDGIIN